jgi:hypothetical protein
MGENAAHYQRGLALSAGILDGLRRSLNGPGKPSAQDTEAVLEYHQRALIHLKVTCDQLHVLPEAEDLKRVLCSMVANELAVVQAFLNAPADYEQHAASTTEDMQIWLLAFDRLCMLAGLPDDPVDT